MSADRRSALSMIAWRGAIGLLSGLLGDGAWDAVAWLGLCIPTAACCWYGLKR